MWEHAIPNLIIGLREGLEAGLIVTILVAAVRRQSTQPHATRPIWLGFTLAVVLSLCFGLVLTFYQDLLTGTAADLFGGILSLIAVGLVTWMIFWLQSTAKTLSSSLKSQVNSALNLGAGSLIMLGFFTVAREGIETSLFIWTNAQAAGSTIAPITGALIGFAIAAVICYLIARGAMRLNLSTFFRRTGYFLIVIAAGILAYGIGDLQTAGVLPGGTHAAFNIGSVYSDSTWWGALIVGITNIQSTMTWLQVTGYVLFVAIVGVAYWNGRSRTAPTSRPSEGAQNIADAAPPGTGAAVGAASAMPNPTESDASGPASSGPADSVPADSVPASSGPANSGPNRTRKRILVGAAFAVPVIAAAALVVTAPKAASSTAISASETACAPEFTSLATGNTPIKVSNTGTSSLEVRLVNATTKTIAGEIEVLGPGATQTLTAAVTAAPYKFTCLNATLNLASATITATGTANTAAANVQTFVPATTAELTPSVALYQKYVATIVPQLQQHATALQTALTSNNMVQAKSEWLETQLLWQQVGAAYGSFGDLGTSINGLPDGLEQGPDSPEFTGLKRLEYGLHHGQPAPSLVPVATQLVADLAELEKQLPKLTFDPVDLPLRGHEIIEDSQRDNLTGRNDQGAGMGMALTYADAMGDRKVIQTLQPLLTSRYPGLVERINSQLDRLEKATLATQNNGLWVPLDQVNVAQRHEVNAATSALLESLALVPPLLEIPPGQ